MSGNRTLLQLLQSRSKVDCDTLDSDVATTFTGLIDCTSNQAIAFGELQKPRHQQLLSRCLARSKQLHDSFREVDHIELAVEIAMVELSLQMAPRIQGVVHIQTNPYYSYDPEYMIASAKRLVSLYRYQNADFDISRVCIKIPSTFEGLQACRTLSSPEIGLKTLATTVFTMEQAVLAADARCLYIAPYLNALVRQDNKIQDSGPDFSLCVSAQRYFEKHEITTKVLAASFHSTDEIMKLAGVHHLTIPPKLLEELGKTRVPSSEPISFFDRNFQDDPEFDVRSLDNADAFKKAISRADDKMLNAIRLFCDMQNKLEDLFRYR